MVLTERYWNIFVKTCAKYVKYTEEIETTLGRLLGVKRNFHQNFSFLKTRSLMSRLERNYCFISTSYLAGLFDIFILLLIIHQIFSLARDWSKRVTWANIPQLKLGNIRGYSPIFKTARVA